MRTYTLLEQKISSINLLKILHHKILYHNSENIKETLTQEIEAKRTWNISVCTIVQFSQNSRYCNSQLSERVRAFKSTN